jgi:hypothetical protein
MSTRRTQETTEHWTDETLPLARRKELLAEDLRRVAPRARDARREKTHAPRRHPAADVPSRRENSGAPADS